MSNPNNENNKSLLYTLGGLVVILLIGSLIYAIANNNSNSNSSSSSKSSNSSSSMAMMNNSTITIGGGMMYPNKDVITNASNASNLTTLVAAVKAADLVAPLQGPGPFTVIAPSNDAFNKLPAGTLDSLLKPENKTKLADILKYHVVSGKFLAKDLTNGQKLPTLQGDTVEVVKTGNEITFRDTNGNLSKVTNADVLQSNGVAYVVDSVMVPKTTPMGADMNPTVGGAAMLKNKNLVENISTAPNLTTLVAAVKAAGLVETLEGAGPFTAFGPTNDAFNKLPAGTVDTLVKPESKDALVKILTYHVVSGKYLTSDLKDGQELTTVQGTILTIIKKDGKVMIKDAKGGMSMIETSDVIQSNGVAHTIDTVLMPN